MLARIVHGGQRRPDGGSLSRFRGTSAHGNQAAAGLALDHPAVREDRTLFPSSVLTAEESPRLLISGHNSAKIGARVRKGAWRGLAVRLHVLGDFYSEAYARFWIDLVRSRPRLHVWGYTAHPADTRMGRIVAAANREIADRWAFRFSVAAEAPLAPMQSSVAWAGEVPSGLICPAQTERTAACSTCGLCWSPAMASRRIVFIGHGRRNTGRPKGRSSLWRAA